MGWANYPPIPSGFNWLAQDQDGEAVLFSNRPTIGGQSWCIDVGKRIYIGRLDSFKGDWRESLIDLSETDVGAPTTPPTTAPEFAKHASDPMAERGKQYDSEDGERSMAQTITAFNAITGQSLKEPDGWL